MAQIIKAGAMQDAQAPRAVVLNLADLAAEARSLVLDARKDAARIVAEAKAKADELRQAAAEQGRAEGFARGQAEGLELGRREAQDAARQASAAEAEETLALAGRIVEELAGARDALLHDARRQMLGFAVELASKIVARVAAADAATAQANLERALELAGDCGQAIVRANPAQLARLREFCPRLIQSLGRRGAVRLVGDPHVGPGGVKVLTRCGEVDATIETQLAGVVEALLGPSGRGQGQYVSETAQAFSAPPGPAEGGPAVGDEESLEVDWESAVPHEPV